MSSADVTYRVVINHEEQYSLWPSGRQNAPGWRDEGFAGTQEQCIQYVDQQWRDMRPLSLRTSAAPGSARPQTSPPAGQ